MSQNRQKMKRRQFLIQNHHRIDDKFSRQRCLDPDTDLDPILKNSWIGIRFVLRGWLRIRCISDVDPKHCSQSSNLLRLNFQYFYLNVKYCVCVCVYLEETGLIKVGWLVHTAYTGCSKKPRNNQYFQSLALHAASLPLVDQK